MARVVMCWELGGDLGHVARMKPLAEALQARGHQVSFVLRECLPAERLLDPARFRWFQAPYQTEPVPSQLVPARSLAQVMHNTGFHAARNLTGRIRAWRALYALLKPDLFVFDHSPTAMLAARGLHIPRLALGTGFGIPPARYPMPYFAGEVDAELKASEDRITATVNETLKDLGDAPLARLADIYGVEAQVFFSFRELDHYADRDAGDYWGTTQQDAGVTPAWPDRPGRRVFAYLKPFDTLPSLLTTLRDAGHPTLIYLGKGAEDIAKQFEGGNLAFSDRPVDLKSAVTEAELVICHSGHGTVSSALLAGKPLLLLPLNMEQRMISARVLQAGAGLVAPALAPEGMQEKFLRLMAEPAFRLAARSFAERHASHTVETIPGRFAELAERLLKSEVP